MKKSELLKIIKETTYRILELNSNSLLNEDNKTLSFDSINGDTDTPSKPETKTKVGFESTPNSKEKNDLYNKMEEIRTSDEYVDAENLFLKELAEFMKNSEGNGDTQYFSKIKHYQRIYKHPLYKTVHEKCVGSSYYENLLNNGGSTLLIKHEKEILFTFHSTRGGGLIGSSEENNKNGLEEFRNFLQGMGFNNETTATLKSIRKINPIRTDTSKTRNNTLSYEISNRIVNSFITKTMSGNDKNINAGFVWAPNKYYHISKTGVLDKNLLSIDLQKQEFKKNPDLTLSGTSVIMSKTTPWKNCGSSILCIDNNEEWILTSPDSLSVFFPFKQFRALTFSPLFQKALNQENPIDETSMKDADDQITRFVCTFNMDVIQWSKDEQTSIAKIYDIKPILPSVKKIKGQNNTATQSYKNNSKNQTFATTIDDYDLLVQDIDKFGIETILILKLKLIQNNEKIQLDIKPSIPRSNDQNDNFIYNILLRLEGNTKAINSTGASSETKSIISTWCSEFCKKYGKNLLIVDNGSITISKKNLVILLNNLKDYKDGNVSGNIVGNSGSINKVKIATIEYKSINIESSFTIPKP